MVLAEYQRALRRSDAWRRVGVMVMNAGLNEGPNDSAFIKLSIWHTRLKHG
jgi:hypothetical protein